MTDPIRVLHISTGLNAGGAEGFLLRLLKHSERPQFDHRVVSLLDLGRIGQEISAMGILVTALHMPRGRISLSGIRTLVQTVSAFQPDILQGWMYHGNWAASLAKAAAPRAALVWNIRSAVQGGQGSFNPLRTSRLFLPLTRRIIYNSQANAEAHIALGYPREKSIVIHNGFDTSRFQPDAGMGSAVRDELGIEHGSPIVGMVGRYDQIKNHHIFLQAVELIAKQFPAAHFVLAGEFVSYENPALAKPLQAAGLTGRVHLLGWRADVARIMTCLDILVLPSKHEGFPNVVGEAMACGVPCVVTDVSDNRYLVGDTGILVPVNDVSAVAEGCMTLLRLSEEARRQRGAAARERIIDLFSLQKCFDAYTDLYHSLARG